MPSVALLLLAACIVVCSGGYVFSGNLSSSDIKNNEWSYRATGVTGVYLPDLLYGGAFYAGDFEGNGGSGDYDFTVGAGYVAITGFPFAYLGYYNGNYNASVSPQGIVTWDLSRSAGVMGTATLWIEERTPSGGLASAKSLQWRLGLLDTTGLSYTQTDSSKASDTIQYIEFTGTSNDPASPNFNVSVTYMASSVAGVVAGNNIENIKLVPGSIESIIRINNYPYASSANALTLVMAVATGEASVAASGQTVYSQDNQVYYSMANQAYISGKAAGVTISAFEAGNFTLIGSNDIQTQITGKYGADAEVKLVRVSFPAGAESIAYDPSIGQGKPANSASTAAVSVLLIVVAVIASML